MTAIENILVGQHNHLHSSWMGAVVRTRAQRREEKEAYDEALRLLDFVGLKGRGDSLAVKLPYGDQRRLEVARALANKPRLLLLDEPTAGMNPSESLQMTDFFRRLRGDLGITVLLIEHEMRVVMGISEKITVLDYGQQDRRGDAEGDPAGSARHRGLSRRTRPTSRRPRPTRWPRRPRRCAEPAPSRPATRPGRRRDGRDRRRRSSRSRTSTPTTAASTPCAGSRLEVGKGEIVALIGGNGAGKSTTLNSISGLVRPQTGRILLEGEDLAKSRPTRSWPRASSRCPRAAGSSPG